MSQLSQCTFAVLCYLFAVVDGAVVSFTEHDLEFEDFVD